MFAALHGKLGAGYRRRGLLSAAQRLGELLGDRGTGPGCDDSRPSSESTASLGGGFPAASYLAVSNAGLLAYVAPY